MLEKLPIERQGRRGVQLRLRNHSANIPNWMAGWLIENRLLTRAAQNGTRGQTDYAAPTTE